MAQNPHIAAWRIGNNLSTDGVGLGPSRLVTCVLKVKGINEETNSVRTYTFFVKQITQIKG